MWWSHIPNIDALPLIFGNENDDKGGEGGAAAGGAGEGAQEQGAGGKAGEELDPQKKILALTEEKDRHWTAAKEASEKLATTAAELEELRKFKQEKDDEKLTADEKVNREIEALKTESIEKDNIILALQESAKKLVINNAFLSNNDVKWHNGERALALADLSAVEIVDKDGVPTLKDPAAMAKAIKDLAESDPYLVDTTEGAPSWQGKTGDGPKPPKKTGEAARKQTLVDKYPALRR
jgi:hypothetical protein